jgi:peptidoglycan hydrolase FlgJ
MAINPGTDLLSEALLAAEPQRAKAAEDRLVRLGGEQNAPTVPDFDALLASSEAIKSAAPDFSRPAGGMGAKGLFSIKPGKPYEQFEVTVLKTLFESMLPQKADAVFGSGLAGGIWKSMMAQSFADVAGRSGIAHIARMIEERKKAKERNPVMSGGSGGDA